MLGSHAAIRAVEIALAELLRKFTDLVARVVALEQSPWLNGGGAAGATGGAAGFYVCLAPSTGTIQGTWSGAAPTAGASFTATVYQVAWASGTPTYTSLGTQTCVNWLPAALANSKACVLVPDGSGAYGVTGQSCT